MARELSQLKVLIVEDQTLVTKLLVAILAEIDVARVFTASDGQEAMAFLESTEETVDLIICDWNMPNMSGLELLQRVRVVYPQIPFVMATSKNDPDSIAAAHDNGVSAYILKPFSLDRVRSELTVVARGMS